MVRIEVLYRATRFLRSIIREEFRYLDLMVAAREGRVITLSLLAHLGVLTRNSKGEHSGSPK